MNLSGNPEHREAYVLSVEPAGPAPGTVSPSRRAWQASWGASRSAGSSKSTSGSSVMPRIRLATALRVQVEPLRGLDDGALLVEVGRERPGRRVGPGPPQLLQRRELITHRAPGGVGGVPPHQHP